MVYNSRDIDDMFHRMELTYNEIVDTLDVKYNVGLTIGYTLPPGINEIGNFDLMLESVLANKVKINITDDDFRLRSNYLLIK